MNTYKTAVLAGERAKRNLDKRAIDIEKYADKLEATTSESVKFPKEFPSLLMEIGKAIGKVVSVLQQAIAKLFKRK